MRRLGNVIGILIVVGALLFCVALIRAAWSHEAAKDPDAQWFTGLERPDGLGSCCTMHDCKRTSDWTIVDGHYAVRGEEGMLTVPDDRVLRNVNNPTGMAVACIHKTVIWANSSSTNQEEVLCFVPPVGT